MIHSGNNDDDTRAGYAALLGRPNVGKSTLLNALVGQKLSIVTPQAQTTREQVVGILTTTASQVVFVDTPGLLEPRYLLHRAMLESALNALREADVLLLLLDARRPADSLPGEEVLERLVKRQDDLILVINKIDGAPRTAIPELEGWCEKLFRKKALQVSALQGEGVESLRSHLLAAIPSGPFLYPPDEIAVQPLRYFVAELIRETIFEVYRDEIPYTSAVRINEYRESKSPVYIQATIYVERESQKAIIIGRNGAAIKKLGQVARRKIEGFIGEPVYLDLWTKTLRRWRSKKNLLRRLGYPVAAEEVK